MITNNGKEIIAKFLLGQAPAYATHIALGCGAKPNSTGDFSAKEVMDFEMISQTIADGAPEKEAWRLAFGLTITLVWLYTELLRLLAIFSGDE